jgi:FkbH-like protein
MPKADLVPSSSPWETHKLNLRELLAKRSIPGERLGEELCIVIFGDCSTEHYSACLKACLKLRGIKAQIIEAGFNNTELELSNESNELTNSSPDFVIFFNCIQQFEEKYSLTSDPTNFVDEKLSEIRTLWDQAKAKFKAPILYHNYCLPLDRSFGNYTLGCTASLYQCAYRINHELSKWATSTIGVSIIDTDFQASLHGKVNWLDERLWCEAKQALSPQYLPSLVKVVSDAILIENGFLVKCVVLDLDNTLWGGILADDGIDGIELGNLNGSGECFVRIQRFFKNLKERGMLLAVCSKNQLEHAEEVFSDHPDMVLKRDDIVSFFANYEDKVQNIIKIRDELNIGYDSMVFLDDSPFERDMVRNFLPEVIVPELPEDPSDYLKCLCECNLFETNQFSDEDKNRARSYIAENKRKEIRNSSIDYRSYLKSLDMVAELKPLDSFSIPRVYQLAQRSNQFNLSTIRYQENELQSILEKPETFKCFTVRLKDKLSDYGIIAFIVAEVVNRTLNVRSWVMSCRVLNRFVEETTFSGITETAESFGCEEIYGCYIRTKKNDLVSRLYDKLGFQLISENDAVKEYKVSLKKAIQAMAPLPITISNQLQND